MLQNEGYSLAGQVFLHGGWFRVRWEFPLTTALAGVFLAADGGGGGEGADAVLELDEFPGAAGDGVG